MKLLFNAKKLDMVFDICLIWLLIQSVAVGSVHGQVSPYATYACTVKIDPDGNGNVFIIYNIFAGDQPLQINSNEIFFPVYNSTAILDNTIDVRDNYDKELTWLWQDSEGFLKVLIGSVSISAGGKYEVRVNYNQENLSRIISENHYFVYEWDFSKIIYSPYTIRQYTLEIHRPSDTLFDTYPIDYIGASPANLNNYIVQRG